MCSIKMKPVFTDGGGGGAGSKSSRARGHGGADVEARSAEGRSLLDVRRLEAQLRSLDGCDVACGAPADNAHLRVILVCVFLLFFLDLL